MNQPVKWTTVVLFLCLGVCGFVLVSPQSPRLSQRELSEQQARQVEEAWQKLFGPVIDRANLASPVARAKWLLKVPLRDKAREESMLAGIAAKVADKGPEFQQRVAGFFRHQIEASLALQDIEIRRLEGLKLPEYQSARDLASDLRPELDRLNTLIIESLIELEKWRPNDSRRRDVPFFNTARLRDHWKTQAQRFPDGVRDDLFEALHKFATDPSD